MSIFDITFYSWICDMLGFISFQDGAQHNQRRAGHMDASNRGHAAKYSKPVGYAEHKTHQQSCQDQIQTARDRHCHNGSFVRRRKSIFYTFCDKQTRSVTYPYQSVRKCILSIILPNPRYNPLFMNLARRKYLISTVTGYSPGYYFKESERSLCGYLYVHS